MRSIIFIISLIIFFSFGITSCHIKKEATKSHTNDIEKKEWIELDFEILTDEISLNEIKKIEDFKERLIAYLNLEILATLKQISKTDKNIKFDHLIINENFEIINIKRESKSDLIRSYDYTPIFDPETYEDEIRDLKPNQYSIDSINLVNDFKFYSSAPDTFLIRIKKQYFEKEIYSNWDTLIIK